MTDDELFVDGVETPELDQFELDRRVMKIMEYVDAYANEAKLYLTGVILLLAGIFIGATFKAGVDDRFFQLLGGTTAALSFY